jgi:exodeoxyribonuclease VII small subunit
MQSTMPSSPSKATTPPGATPGVPGPVPASYEAALQELEQLVSSIESGQMPLEQLLSGYQRGAELLGFCRERLQAVEGQIKVLDDGVLKPWTQE